MLYDEPLEPEAQAWLDAVAARGEGRSAAYEMLLGLDAPLAQDPRELGRQRLAESIARGPMGMQAEPASAVAAPPRLAKVGAEALCHVSQASCFARFSQDTGQAQRLLDEHPVPLQRYRQVLGLTDYRSLAIPGALEPLPAYGVLVEGNRLLGLQALVLARTGQAVAARQLLEEDLAQLRRQLARSDQLIGKMVSVSLVAADLDLLARLRAEGLLGALHEQPALSPQERDMLPALQREFASRALYFLAMPASLETETGFSPSSLKLLYKARQSVNLMFAQDQLVAQVAALDAAAFAEDSRLQALQPTRPWQRPNNPIGVILVSVAGPDLQGYLARLHDLDAKVRLFNLLTRLPLGESPSPSWLAGHGVENPYQSGALPMWVKPRGELCFSGPLEDPRGLRCIIVRSATPDEPAANLPASSAP